MNRNECLKPATDRYCFGIGYVFAALLGILPYSHELHASGAIEVKLSSTVECNSGMARFNDVAHVTGKDSDLLRTILGLDLCRLEAGETRVLSLEFIQLRLSLAGLRTDNIRWTGTRSTTLFCDLAQTDLLKRLEREIESEIALHLGRSRHELRIRFLRPLQEVFINEVHPALKDRGAILNPEVILATGNQIGRTTIDIRLLKDRDIVCSRSVPVEIAVKQKEFRLAKFVERQQILTAEHVTAHESFVTSRLEEIALEDVLGRTARKDLRAGERLKLSDLYPVAQASEKEVVVRPRDALRLIARHKNLEYVVPQAEAMQSGKVGQIIRVRNLQSNRVVNARLVSHDEAVVDLQ